VVVNRDDLPPAELPTFLGYNPEPSTSPIGVGNGPRPRCLPPTAQRDLNGTGHR
jgi:hypothetical protein